MKRLSLVIVLVLSINFAKAQIHEIGIFGGGSNYVGDVGETQYINPDKLALGILYKWNRSPRHSYRISYTQSSIQGNDADSKEGGRNQRGYQFKNSIKEISAGLEFNFFEFNLHELETQFTPYIYSGISYSFYEELYFQNGEAKKDDNKATLAIPMTVGIKTNILTNFVLGFEVGARYSFTDNLDGSNPKNNNLQAYRFGNINNDDWYVFTGFTLTYTFGEKPCYCAE